MLAGVGAEQCIDILAALFQQPFAQSSTFIISPATKVFFVRQFLSQQQVYLIDEQTVTENKRTYEIITVQLNNAEQSQRMQASDDFLFGTCWQLENPDHRSHLEKLLSYYQASQSKHEQTLDIISGYKKILKNFK